MNPQDGVFFQVEQQFEQLVNRNSSWSAKYCERLASKYNLPAEDADDIYTRGFMRVWQRHCAPDSDKRYEFQGEKQERSFLRQAFTWGASDLRKQQQKDKLLLEALRLDEPFNDSGDGGTLADVIPASRSESETVEAVIILEKALAEECKKARTGGKALVIQYLLDEITKEEVIEHGYDENYIRVVKHRLKQVVGHAMAEVCK